MKKLIVIIMSLCLICLGACGDNNADTLFNSPSSKEIHIGVVYPSSVDGNVYFRKA